MVGQPTSHTTVRTVQYTKARMMEFYLLGDNERKKSTDYLHLEFRKPGTEEYCTIGIGMRAQKGKSFDFWGFCLRDGRRIGPGGLHLYEKESKCPDLRLIRAC